MYGNAKSNLATLPDFAKGMAKGPLNDAGGLLKMVGDPGGFGTSLVSRSQPSNKAQEVGRNTEQVGEFFVPGLDGEGLVSKLAPAWEAAAHEGPTAANLARAASKTQAAKVLANAASTGLLTQAQGGNGILGGLLGGAGSLMSLGAIGAAPTLAEIALGVLAVPFLIRRLD
jgi:hypothetical protein